MHREITSFCGRCNTALSLAIGSSPFCGTTHIECKTCGTLNKTNDKPYSQMSLGDKIWAILKNFVFDILFIIPLGIIILFFIANVEQSSLLGIAVLVFFGYNGYKVVTLIDIISKIEKEQKRIDDLINKI